MRIKLDNDFFADLLSKANESPRKRSHFNLHQDLNEAVQRLCIGLKKGTYVRPHHHPQDNKWELLLVLRGSVCFVIFDHDGHIIEKLTLNPGDNLAGIEITPNTWHTVYPATDDAVILEVKEGPYTATQKNDFASWAPDEGDENVNHFLTWLENAGQGERFHN